MFINFNYHNQINKIPVELNSSDTIIFLSAGGNDILSHYVDQNQDITNTSILISMFDDKIRDLISSLSIHTVLNFFLFIKSKVELSICLIKLFENSEYLLYNKIE